MKTRVEPVRYADIASSRELDDFLEIVRNLLNVQIGFSPVGSTVGGQPVLARPRAAENPLCHMIRAAPGGLAACLACDKKHGDDAIQTRRGIHYVCHAGLVDFFVPVAIDNRIVGILSGGQVLPEPPTRQGFERLRKRLAKLGIGSTELRDAYFKSPFLPMEKAEATLKLITLFTELIAERGVRVKPPSKAKLPGFLKTGLEHMNQRFRDSGLTLPEVAECAGVSVSHFASRFKRHMGVLFNHYLLELRLREAEKLLLGSDRRIAEIALRSGFGSVSHFNRVFKSRFHRSPKGHRGRRTNFKLPDNLHGKCPCGKLPP